DSPATLHGARVASFRGVAIAWSDRRWYLGRTFIPVGDWSRGSSAPQLGAAELTLSTSIHALVRSVFTSVGSLAPYLGILIVFGVLFSIIEGIAVRSGRSNIDSVVEEAATL